MGKKSTKIPVAAFKLRRGRIPGTEGTLYIQYFVDGKYISRSTNIKLFDNQWDAKAQKVLSTHRDHIRLNNRLITLKSQYDNAILGYNGIVNERMVSDLLDGKAVSKEDKPEQTDFIQYALDFNDQRYELGKIGYSTFYNAKRSLIQFQDFIEDETKDKALPISRVSLDLINKYINWRLNVKKNGREATNKTLTPIFKALKNAADNELIPLSVAMPICSSYLDIKSRSYSSKTSEKDPKFLTPEQLKLFINLYPTMKYDRTRDIMDMFLFSVYACGLRVSDIITLEWSHIDMEKKTLTKNTVKNNVLVEVPLNDKAMEILQRWKKKGKNPRFVFGMLDVDFNVDDPEKMTGARLTKNRTIVQSLNEIGRKMKLPFSLSFHCARHTFAVIALKNGVDLFMLSRLLGHSTIGVTQSSYARFLKEDVKKTVREKLSFEFC